MRSALLFCLIHSFLLLFLKSPTITATETTTIAFGSCAHQDNPLPILTPLAAANPTAFIWLGDAAYVDTAKPEVMRRKYNKQRQQPGYLAFTANRLITGTWDDHDYGKNDAGKEWRAKSAAQQAYLDFLGVPTDDPRRQRQGVYVSHDIGQPGRLVRVILLDARYHRTKPAVDGDTLGEEQWQWLRQQLANSPAQVHLLGSGIQVLSDDHPYETWGTFPQARQRLFSLIKETQAKGVILLSGDRHITELSLGSEDLIGYPLYDLTSSGMNRGWKNFKDFGNRKRVGSASGENNAGLITIDWQANTITLQTIDQRGADLIKHRINLADLE